MVQKYFSNITKMLLKSYSKVAFEMIADIAKMLQKWGNVNVILLKRLIF